MGIDGIMTLEILYSYAILKNLKNNLGKIMKKYTSTLLLLLLSGTFIGCSSTDTKVKEQNQTMPTCTIEKGTPLTDSMITVHVNCKNGNIPIDEATVTVDNTVKNVDYNGTKADDYIGFKNLQPNTSYKAVLDVVVGGETITESVKIRTKDTKHTAPVWRKKVYDVYKGIEDIDNNKIDLNLKQEVSSKEGDKITYKVISNSYKIVDDSTCLQDLPFLESESIQIDANSLIVKYSPPCVGIITSVVQAKSVGGVSNATIKINFELYKSI